MSADRTPAQGKAEPLVVFLIAGEESGDQLGGPLMEEIAARAGRPVRFVGIGGRRMEAAGLSSLFPLSDIALMGLDEIIRRLPFLLSRIRETADAVVAARPDALVIIDAPDFTHRVARRVRRRAPDIPVVDYVSPTVWAWRPGRARAMARYVDTVLAVLPFEPAVHRRLGGPPCVYVGHPVLEPMEAVRAARAERPDGGPPTLLVLPGSRRSEVSRLMEPFGAAVARLAADVPDMRVVLPAVDHVAEAVAERAGSWAVRPEVVRGVEAKRAAFVAADAALAASGTVTLELGIAGVPMVVAYRLDRAFRLVKRINGMFPIVTARSMVLSNIVLDGRPIPEFLDDEVTGEALAAAVLPLLAGGAARERQLAALAELSGRMALPGGAAPSEIAAEAVLDRLRAGPVARA